ncbi:hypothetical protein [Bacillus atrophaeus]
MGLSPPARHGKIHFNQTFVQH